MVDSGKEALGQGGLRARAGAFRVGRGLREFLCCSTGASTGRKRRQTSQRTPANSSLFSSSHVSVIHPAIRGSQVPAERRQAKARREASETGTIDAPPAGAPKATKLKRQARSRVTANARRPRQGLLQIWLFLSPVFP